jgi:hypothetical protein
MIATIANELVQNGTYECYIKVVNEDNNIYWVQKSVPISEATNENKELWLTQAIQEAEASNTPPMPEVVE